jgi:hypothetical protein
MAKIKVFQYLKETGERKDYELLVIKDEKETLEGISIHDLGKEDKEKVLDIYKKFEEALEPYMKHYRRFKKSHIAKLYN